MARATLAVAVPAMAVVAVLLVLCGCCVAAGQRRRPRGPDGVEVEGLSSDGPVVSYRGGYKYTTEGSSACTPTSPSSAKTGQRPFVQCA
ncbi:unnamed protein product [Urochloa humidicola]